MRKSSTQLWIIIISQLVASMLVMLPLPGWAQALRPDWVALITIYWCLALPNHFGIGITFIFGLLLDITLGTLLGQHTLGLIVAAYLALRLHQRMRIYPPMQQGFIVMIFLFIKQLIVLWIYGITGVSPQNIFLYFLPCIIGMLVWPWISIFMYNIRRRNVVI